MAATRLSVLLHIPSFFVYEITNPINIFVLDGWPFLMEITLEILSFQFLVNAKNVPSNLLTDRRSNYAFLGLTCRNTRKKDSSLHLYKKFLPSCLVNRRRLEFTGALLIRQLVADWQGHSKPAFLAF